MTYIRPSTSQIDLWPSLGLELNWNKLFSFSKKSEHFQTPSPELSSLGASYHAPAHGFHGPLAVSFNPHLATGNLHNTFNETWKKLGIPPNLEFDSGELRGFGVWPQTLDGHADVREDAARAYYYPIAGRENLVVLLNTTAKRILWTNNGPKDSALATGVEVTDANGATSTICANEVILSAGSLRSPALLENSGVGNPSILSRYSIDVEIDLPSVGENLQDQPNVLIYALALENSTGYPAYGTFVSLKDVFGSATSAEYETALSNLPTYANAIAAQNGGASSAAVQEDLLKTQLDLLYESNTPTSEILPILENISIGPIVGAAFWTLLPFSRGNVHINSTDMTAPPRINPNFFQQDWDGKVQVATARLVRKFLATEPVSNIVNASTITPSFDELPEDASDEAWLAWIKANYGPNYHPLGTCAMLPKEKGGVVDNDFKVYGTRNVRVVDASVIPLQVAGHLTSALYGIAEWASVKLKADSQRN